LFKYYLRRFIGFCLIIFGISSVILGAFFIPATFSGCGLGFFVGFWYAFVLFIAGGIKVRLGYDFLKSDFKNFLASFLVSSVYDALVWYYFFYLPNPLFLNEQIMIVYVICCYCFPFAYLRIINKKH
jgi:hypothetical protein